MQRPSSLLIIDDDQHIYERVRDVLEGVVGAVDWCDRPERGIQTAISTQPDVILLDVNMPGMDGLKVCRLLKSADATRDVPVIFVTVERNVSSLERALDCGGADYVVKPFDDIELRARVRAAIRTKHMIDLLKEQARIDPLTGLCNRAALDDALEASVAAHARLGQPFALMMLDIDHFKGINDSHGHGVGDAILRGVADALSVRCRPYDTPGRFGGDEFAVVLGQTEGENARGAAARILECVRHVAPPETCPRSVTCSAGLTSTSALPDGFTPGDVLKAADEALYEAKASGRDRLAVSAV